MDLANWHLWWKRTGATELRRLLMEAWDPIHVRGIPEAADEYDGYLGQISSRLRAGTTAEQLASYLTYVEEDLMGLGASKTAKSRALVTAKLIIDWYHDAIS
jgi:methyl coenzyme M reductase subunit C-like uncharacterized protein (methanogenesis marker protein 7)